MQYVKLGKTGVDVSRICLGCMSFGVPGRENGVFPWAKSLDEARPMMKRALDLGINYISPLPKGIRAGDTLRLSLVKSPSHAPKDVEWYCDGEACSTTIQADSGIHTVKAVLSFKDGHTETLETQYRAE